MKFKIRTLFPFIVLLFSSSVLLAQEPATEIDSLYVAFWPDYDDPSVLILMTGTLPADAAFPAEVTIPIPSGAEVNAVASVGEEGMVDTEYELGNDTLTLVTTDPRFRVEFYAPYEEEGDQHFFDYAWNAEVDVKEFVAEVQQPVNATKLTTQPPAANIGTSPNDGLTYHAMPEKSLPAGTPYELTFRYDMAEPGLTASAPAPVMPEPVPEAGGNAAASSTDNWLLIGAGIIILLLVIAVTWLLATRGSGGRRSKKPRKPAPKERSTQAKFCHSCGAQAANGDQFCRTCGKKLK